MAVGEIRALRHTFGDQANEAQQTPMGLESVGLSGDALSEQLGRFIREVRVVVWWGPTAKRSQERGEQVVLVTHIMSEKGAFQSYGGQEAP